MFVCALGPLLLPLFNQAAAGEPIPTRNHLLPSLAFLRFEPLSNLGPGIKEDVTLGLTSANVFLIHTSGNRSVIQDYEVERLALQYRRRMKGGWTGTIEVPYVFVGGGFQDALIDWWHSNLLHWTDPNRAASPRGKTWVHIGDRDFGVSATGIGDVTTIATREWGPRTLGAVAIKWPTGNSEHLQGSGGLDIGVSGQHRFSIAKNMELHAQLGAVWQGPSQLPRSRSWAHQELLALTWQPNSRDTWIVQWQGESAPLHLGISDVDGTQRLISLGYRRRLDKREELTAYLSEDGDLFERHFPEGASLGPDFTFGLQLRIRF